MEKKERNWSCFIDKCLNRGLFLILGGMAILAAYFYGYSELILFMEILDKGESYVYASSLWVELIILFFIWLLWAIANVAQLTILREKVRESKKKKEDFEFRKIIFQLVFIPVFLGFLAVFVFPGSSIIIYRLAASYGYERCWYDYEGGEIEEILLAKQVNDCQVLSNEAKEELYWKARFDHDLARRRQDSARAL